METVAFLTIKLGDLNEGSIGELEQVPIGDTLGNANTKGNFSNEGMTGTIE